MTGKDTTYDDASRYRRSLMTVLMAELAVVTGMAARTVWAWRLELTLTLVVAVVFFQTLTLAFPLVIVTLLLLTTAGVAYLSRRSVPQALHNAGVKRQWARATRDCGLHDRCHKVTATPVGDRLDVRVRRGHAVQTLEQNTEHLAGCLAVSDVRVVRDPDHGGRAAVTLITRDPFLKAPPVSWPPLHDDTDLSVWDNTRVGLTEHGDPLTYPLVGNNILIGGLIGAGKSVFLRTILATCALSTYPVRLHLLDAKLLELHPWSPLADHFVGRDGPRAIQVLEQLIRIADQRQADILGDGKADKIRQSSRLPIHVLIIDELAEFTQMKEGKQFTELLRSITSRGRALGIVTVAATQYSRADIVDAVLRGQFKTRVGFRVADHHMGGVIFGDSEPAMLASKIRNSTPGVAYAQDETGRYVRFRADAILRPDDDNPDRPDDVQAIVDRAVAHRVDAGFADLKVEPPLKGEDTGASEQCKPKPQWTGRNSKRDAVKASLLSQLRGSEVPLSLSDLARGAGRKPSDGLVRLALGELAENGRAVRNADGKWTEAT